MADTGTGRTRKVTFEPTTAPGRPKPKEVLVYILTDAITHQVIDVVPYGFRISKQNFQEVTWVCVPEQDFSVDFNKNGSPFYEDHFDQDNPCSGLPMRKGTGLGDKKVYDYTITTSFGSLDPQGVVDP